MNTPRSRLIALLTITVAASLQAQTVPANNTGDEVVQLSQFEVKGTADNGYNVNTATAGLKTTQALLEIPTPVEVVSRSLIDDLGFDWMTTDYARYVAPGLASYGANDQIYLRGQKLSWMFKDGNQYFPSANDDAVLQTIEVVQGINGSLFGTLPAISGMVIQTTKQPEGVAADSIRLIADANGGVLRTEVDSTGPLPGKLFGADVDYRLVLVGQDGDMKQIYDDNRLVISPSFSFNWRNTELRVRYEYSDITDFGLYENNFLNQFNQVSTIGGASETYKAPWSRSRFRKGEFEVNLTNIYTPEIQSNLQFMYEQEIRSDHDNRAYLVSAPGVTSLASNSIIPVTPSSVLDSTVLQLSQNQYSLYLNDDFVANYPLWGSDQQTNWGIGAGYLYNAQALIQPSLGDISVINPIFPADPGPIAIPGADDTISITNVGDVYLQDQAKLFSDHLILIAGGAGSFNQTTTHTAIASPIYSEAKGSKWTYKIGAVYKLLDGLSAYTSRATAFVPQSPGIVNQFGQPLAPVSSIDEEVGIKTDGLFHGVLSGSFGGFYSSTLNQSIAVNPGQAGGYYISSGRTDTRGLETAVTLTPWKGLEVIATLFDGNGVFSSATAAYANRTMKNTASAVAKYSFATGALKGLAFGAKYVHMGKVYVLPAPSYPEWNLGGLFASYTFGRCQISATLDNLTNAIYDAGGNNRYQVTIGQPRTLELALKYRL